jgi:hypothetical protein
LVRPKLNRTTGPYDDISNRHSYPVAVVFFPNASYHRIGVSPSWKLLFTSFRDTKQKRGMQIVEPNEEKKRQKFDKIINIKKAK